VPLRLFTVDLDRQPVANPQIGEDVDQMVADYDGILVAGG
jgi:hypothetical protein